MNNYGARSVLSSWETVEDELCMYYVAGKSRLKWLRMLALQIKFLCDCVKIFPLAQYSSIFRVFRNQSLLIQSCKLNQSLVGSKYVSPKPCTYATFQHLM